MAQEMTVEKIDTGLAASNQINLALTQEWLDANGLGGYASSTVSNCHTRKYHGLLVAADLETTQRQVLLSKLEERVEVDGSDKFYYLSTHYYLPNVYVPGNASELLEQDFCGEFNPKWTYHGENFSLIKEILMPQDMNTTLVKYSLKAKNGTKLKLKLRPLIACRNFHHLAKENSNFNQEAMSLEDGIKLKPYLNMPELLLQTSNASEFTSDFSWYRNFSYQEEKARGYDHTEDLASPGFFTIELKNNQSFYFSASADIQVIDHHNIWEEEKARRHKSKNNKFNKALEKAAADFIIRTKDNNLTILAGYHWFGSWGRDTMISLPGLFLETNYQSDFKKVIRHFLNYEQDGLIPNMIGKDRTDSAYNSVDASLWLFWAIQEFAYKLKKYDWIKKDFWEEIKNIFNSYADGKTPTVKCHENGLLESGNEYESLSWMDACLDGKSVILRYGYLVEINALWYNAVAFVEELAQHFKDPIAEKAADVRERIENNFTKVFYNEDKGYLADYVRGSTQNLQVRPNQILAISLPYSPISDEIGVKILAIVIEQLFTPMGLRTLSPQDADYCGIYQGDTYSRDRAYHNGTVWPWLLGPLGDALIKLNNNKTKAKKQVRAMVESFTDTLEDSSIGSIAEIYDGDFPHQARGCVAQAWSVAEVRRLLIKSN